MSSPYESRANGLDKGDKTPAVRPKDAATLILVRRDAEHPRVLLGKRSAKHAFMPDKFVFPGGRVDPGDGRVPSLSELPRDTEGKLCIQARRKPRAFALTAIRETFEETGLIVGRTGEVAGTRPPGWPAYFEEGAAPCLKGLHFVGRAVTPPYRPKRFDARFFYGEAEDVLIDERPAMDGAELSELTWVTIEDSMAMDLPTITRFMLGEIKARLEGKDEGGPAFLRWSRGRHTMDRL
ncbi:MAG: NUDIX hydrolase [Pseudomonadota bacterium]